MDRFVHLHLHTEYSLLDGACRLDKLLNRAERLGYSTLAITDHGVLYGVIDFYRKAREHGIKPLIGMEAYVAKRRRSDKESGKDDDSYHLLLLAENSEGYKNLMRLSSSAFIEGFYYKPRIDLELLERYRGGLIALSGCIAGEIPRAILERRDRDALDIAARYRDLFGAENFFLEIQRNSIPEQKIANEGLLKISEELSIPIVATNDVHYIEKEDSYIHDVLLCIQTGKMLDDKERMRFQGNDYYLRSPDEMAMLFADHPEALENTVGISERCNLELEFGSLYLPKFTLPEGDDPDLFLRRICYEGAEKIYGSLSDDVKERLELELGVIKQMGYSGYFLIVWDFIRYAKENGIYVGARGSAAGSLVAYVIGITAIDPLKYDLIFERFLNPDRVTMPDIDVDFCFERRGEVIDYVIKKYGADRVAQIITFGTMAARAAIRDVGRVLGLSVAEVDRVAKMIPMELNITIDKALELNPKLREQYNSDDRCRKLIDTARAVEGMPRHSSIHAAGIVISGDPLTERVPLCKTSEGAVTTQYVGETLGDLGLLKMDFLGLRNLTLLRDAVELIKRSRGVRIDLDNLPLDEERVYRMLRKGDSLGVFQLESRLFQRLLKEIKPTCFEDIVAINALGRPGPLSMVDEYIRRKNGEVKAEYLHESLRPILEPTYGIMLYQEQVMRIAAEVGGFTMGEADVVRDAMGKKKQQILAGMRNRFIRGAEEKGIDAKTANGIFDLMEKFAGYGFNKSHSASYSLIAYQTAYLKACYLPEYMASLMSSVMGNSSKIAVYVDYARKQGISILPPDINQSDLHFSVREKEIRFGLIAVKNVGANAVQAILAVRKAGEFKSLLDFCERVDLSSVTRKAVESLIRCGAMDSLGLKRTQLLSIMDGIYEYALGVQRERESGQLSLIDLAVGGGENPELPYYIFDVPDIPEFHDDELLTMEKELLGLYITGHPLEPFREILSLPGMTSIDDIEEAEDREAVIIGGIISGVRHMRTRRGEAMAVLTLQDFKGEIEVVLFPQTLSGVRDIIEVDKPVFVRGKVDVRDESRQVIAESLGPIEADSLKLIIEPSSFGPEKQRRLKAILSSAQGLTPVIFKVRGMGGAKEVSIILPPEYWVSPTPSLFAALKDALGEERYLLPSE